MYSQFPPYTLDIHHDFRSTSPTHFRYFSGITFSISYEILIIPYFYRNNTLFYIWFLHTYQSSILTVAHTKHSRVGTELPNLTIRWYNRIAAICWKMGSLLTFIPSIMLICFTSWWKVELFQHQSEFTLSVFKFIMVEIQAM